GGQLGGGLQESSHDHGHHQLALPARSSGQHPVEAELTQAAEHGQHVAVGQAAFDGELVIESADGLSAEDGADGLDSLDGESGEVGKSAVLDLAFLAEGLSEQVGLVLAVALSRGDDGYVHCTAWPSWHAAMIADWTAFAHVINGYISAPTAYSNRTRP